MKKIVYIVFGLFITYCAKSQCPVALKYDTSFCSAGNFNITIDASVLDTSLCVDSVTIVLNAANTVLAGDTNVYMLSAPQFTPFVAWGTNPYTTGSTSQNNGIGRMTSLGNNKWSITIHPQTYYNYPADTCLNGLWMVFHNYNGSVYLNSDDASTNYFVLTNTTGNAVSEIDPTVVTASKEVGNVTYRWNDGNMTNPRTFTTGGSYTVTATGAGGCTASGSVTIRSGAHAPVTLGSNMIRCTANTPVVLNAGPGFASFLWLNDSVPTTRATYTATNPGCYWVLATDSVGCTSSSTVQIENSEVTNLSIPDSLNACNGQITIDASTNVNRLGDSIVIIYNATKGNTELAGVDTIYFHSGPQFTPSQGWQGNYTPDIWGTNNDFAKMTPLGNNLWRIAIDPYCYYKINPDSLLTGIWMLFRNSDGTLSGRNDADGNILVNIVNQVPTSTFEGVTASRTPRLPLTYTWSAPATGPVINITSANTYIVTLSDNNGCSAIQSVDVTFNPLPAINLGAADTTICIGSSVVLNAGTGFKSYSWNNTDTTQTISATGSGTYSVTATNSLGCQTTGSIVVTADTNSANFPVFNITASDSVYCGQTVTLQADSGFTSYTWNTGASTSLIYAGDSGTYSVTVTNTAGCTGSKSVYLDTCGGGTVVVVGCGSPTASFTVLSIGPENTVVFSDSSLITKINSYYWTFGDGTSDSVIGGAVHTYANSGSYWVTLAITDSCGGYSVDSMLVNVNITGIASISGLSSFTIYPNPSSGIFNLEILLTEPHPVDIVLYDEVGHMVWQNAEELVAGRHTERLDASYLSGGIYLLELRTNAGRVINKITITK